MIDISIYGPKNIQNTDNYKFISSKFNEKLSKELNVKIPKNWDGVVYDVNSNLSKRIASSSEFLKEVAIQKQTNFSNGAFQISLNKDPKWYIGEVILENKRNKPVTIKAIHLQLGNNYAVNLKEYDEPFVLEPLSTIKIKIEPVSLYLISDNIKVNLEEEFKKVKEKTLVITSTDRLIKVKNFNYCPSFIAKVLYEQPFAEITSYRDYWDEEFTEVVNANAHFHIKVRDKNNKIQDTIDVSYNNVLHSFRTSRIILKQEDTENATKLEQKLRAVLPYMQDDFNIEIMENKIHDRIHAEEKPLKHYGFLHTKALNLLYKIYLRNKKL